MIIDQYNYCQLFIYIIGRLNGFYLTPYLIVCIFNMWHCYVLIIVILYLFSGATSVDDDYYLLINSADSRIATAKKEINLKTDSISGFYVGNFTVTGNFLGK